MKAAKRVIDILNLYTAAETEFGVTQVARQLKTNKSTVSRLMSTLAAGNVIARTPITRKYHLGSKILELAGIILSNIDIRKVATPYLVGLQQKTRETVSIYVREGNTRVCIDRVEGSHIIRFAGRIGQSLPLHAGAGKVFLAFLPVREVNEVIQCTGLTRYTDLTVTNKHQLKEQLDEIRKSGVAISIGDIVDSAAVVAAPIRNHLGNVFAVLTITGPTNRFTPAKLNEFSNLVKEAAASISSELGYP